MKRVGQQIKTSLSLALFLPLVLFMFSACDCGSTKNSANPEPVEGPDDDSISDDDSTADDDADDDSSTTTTTAPPTSSTTTTVVTTTTTTTTRPGEGSACDPFVEDPEVIDREKPFGPWPEFEERGITFRQIISSGAGQGQNDILFTGDGLARVAAQDGRSLDVIAVGPAGEVSREVVDPRGGEWKVLGKDADDHLYMAYTVHTDQYPETWELRTATNKSGVWAHETLFTSHDDATLSFDMAVDAAGLMHIVFTGRDESAVAYYSTWDGDTYTETQIASSPGGWRYIYALALDSAGSPHALFSESTGTWHWRIEDSAWVGDLATGNAFAWDLVIDANGVLHAGLSANGGHLVYGRFESGVWTFEDLDDCQDGVSFISLRIDGAGHLHISYTDGNQNDVLYATNASGEWIHTFLYEEVDTESADLGHAWDMASALDANGKIHIVHRRYNDYYYSRDSDLNLSTNGSGVWLRTRLVKGSMLVFNSGILDSQDRFFIAFNRDQNDRLVCGSLVGDQWIEQTIDLVTVRGLITDATVAIKNNNAPSILYGKSYGDFYEYNELKYAEYTGPGWTTEILADDADYFGQFEIQFDSQGQPHALAHADYIGNDEILYLTNTNGNWEYDVVPGPDFSATLLIDADDRPVVAHTGSEENSINFSKRQAPGVWTNEMAMSSSGRFAVPLAEMREDGTIDFVSAISDAVPSGFFYATNETGVWSSEFPTIFDHLGSARLTIDSYGQAHISVTAYDNEYPEGYGIYYITNAGDRWNGLFIENWFGDMHPIGIHQKSNDDIFLYYDYFGGQALMTASFEPGME